MFFSGEGWWACLPFLALQATTNANAYNDDDYDDDMLITGVKIIIIITAVGSQMYNSRRCNYIRAIAAEKIHFSSTPQPLWLLLDLFPAAAEFPCEMSAPSPIPPVTDKEAVYKIACSRAIKMPCWDHKSFNRFVQLGRKMLLLLLLLFFFSWSSCWSPTCHLLRVQ